MDQDGMWRMVGEARAEILGFLRALKPAQLETPSLRQGSRIRDVAVHLLIDEPARKLRWPRAPAIVAGKGFSHDRAAGFRLRATDLDWSPGDGPAVSGPAEARVMALAGRSTALTELHGVASSF
jgi:hypothetical protein